MNKKIVDYGTTYQVIVHSADSKCIICGAPSINEGFVLLYHGIEDYPTKGDEGKIVFEKDSANGHWQYYPSL
jgi:hypothetical protein